VDAVGVVDVEVLVEVVVDVVVEQNDGVTTFPGSTLHPSLTRATPAEQPRVIKLSPARLI